VPSFTDPAAQPTARGFYDAADTGEGRPVKADTLKRRLADAHRDGGM
jgi:hypothetical protein